MNTNIANNTQSYLYLKSNDPLIQQTKPGIIIKDHWMATDFQLPTANISLWPAQLWRVEIMDLGPAQNDEIKANFTKNRHCNHAAAVKLIDPVSPTRLFGEEGKAVCELLDKIPTLTLQQMALLASLDQTKADIAYSKAWDKWLQEHDPSRVGDNHSMTLAVGPSEQVQSPIHNGFILISTLIYKLARQQDGNKAFVEIEQQGKVETHFAPFWRNVLGSLLHIAMGLGATQYIESRDLPFLLAGLEYIR